VFNNWYWFYLHKTFFVLKPNFDIFAEIHQKKLLKIHVAVWHHTYFWVPLSYNKPRNWCNKGERENMKFRKLTKNNVRNTNTTWQLKQEVLELFSVGIHEDVQRRDRKQKMFRGNITSIPLLNIGKFDNSFSLR